MLKSYICSDYDRNDRVYRQEMIIELISYDAVVHSLEHVQDFSYEFFLAKSVMGI